jgi:TetR/AcrR family transcriptional regulator
LPRNSELNQKVKDERRAQILSSALMLFATRGLSATKIKDISLAAGISQGLVYHYFRSKEEIFVELIRDAFERMNTACRGLEDLPVPPAEKIKMAIEKLLQGLESNENTARTYLLITQATVSEAIPEAAKLIIKRENTVPYKVLARIIAGGQKKGSLRKDDPDEMALVFWTSIKGLAIHKAVHGKKFKAPDPDILMRMFFPG